MLSKELAISCAKDLELFDPYEAVKTMAVNEVAEKYFKRAKNPERLYKAIENKLVAQREFVVWWDQQERRGGKQGDRSDTLQDFHLDKETVYRWRNRLVDQGKFSKYLTSIKAKTLKTAGLTTSEAHRCEKLDSVPQEEFTAYIEKCRISKCVVSSDEITKRANF